MSGAIIQIVPRLAPPVGGVADYAYLLARQLRDDHEIHSCFLVGDPAWDGSAKLDSFSVDRLDHRQANELARRLKKRDTATVLLHYVGYGYQERGCPVWLLNGLTSWKQQSATHRLVVMFHELFATGMPWQSSFWTAPLQKQLAKSLALLSDHCVTNRKNSAETLSAMASRSETDFTVLPVFSTVGERLAPFEWHRRKPRMIVFGGAEWRRQAYIDRRKDLARAIEALGIEEVVDIGLPCGDVPKLPVKHSLKGILTAAAIDREMADACAGYYAYPNAYLGKSTIFAAYAAHGLLPITYSGNTSRNEDGLIAGAQYLRLTGAPNVDKDRFEQIAQHAYRWYRQHHLRHQAACYAAILGKLPRLEQAASRLTAKLAILPACEPAAS